MLSALYICPGWQPVGMAADVSLSVRSPHHLWEGDRRYEYVSKKVTVGYGNVSKEIKIKRYFRSKPGKLSLSSKTKFYLFFGIQEEPIKIGKFSRQCEPRLQVVFLVNE